MSNMLTRGMGTLVSTVRRMVLVKNIALVICTVVLLDYRLEYYTSYKLASVHCTNSMLNGI